MKDIKIDGLTEKITIHKENAPVGQKAVAQVYFNGWAQIRLFQHAATIEGEVQTSETKYLIFIHNRKLPLAHGDIITWLTNDSQPLYVEDFAICSKRDIYRSIRASTTRL